MPTFFELHSQKNILCEWYSYLETVTLVKNNEEIDYTCYKCGKLDENALELGTSKELDIGSTVLVVGYPDYCNGNSPEIQTVNIISERFFMRQKEYTITSRY